MTMDSAVNQAVRQALHRAIAEKGEIGIQVAAYLGEELVIDCWAGVADRESGRPVDADTLFNVFSVSKAVVSTAVHVQAEKGLVEYDRPIADYWPEFAQNGKETITVRDALNHHTGTPQMPPGTTPESMCDWDFMARGIAGLTPILPRDKPAYQAMSFGWVLGEVVRRTDSQRRDFGRFVQEEICEPYGITDLWIGMPDEAERRVATLVDEGSSASFPDDSYFAMALPNNVRLIPDVFERPAVRRAAVAAVGGIFNARSEARFWAIWANGGALDGKRLLSKERVDAACLPRANSEAPDPVYFNAPMPLSQGGFWMYSPTTPLTCPAKGERTICVPGAGGSLGWADPDTGLAVAFCHNRMMRPRSCEDHPLYEIADVIRSSLGV
ncbi:serine hydrolase domain-containing protein [Sphingobium baderi]|uniref:Serine hydrolase n=1 Tax=Sphingobium baderi TaxID=1332080 RepID=A0A0S3F2C7_9SPHN|nr:serine hydrolase domain-containing protein [Sphingobium baderi]ALR21844.1 serine hydrolase [Sphingobium baderi]